MPVRKLTLAGGLPELPYHDLGPQDQAPFLALTAGVAGDELNAIYVLGRLARFLNGIEAGEQGGYRLAKRILLLALSERPQPAGLPAAVLEATRDAHIKIDIANAGDEFETLPTVHLIDAFDDERATAFLFGLPAILELTQDEVSRQGLVPEWRQHGGENFLLQCGIGGSLQLHHCQRLFQALINFLVRVGVLDGPEDLEVEEDVHLFGAGQTLGLAAEGGGMFVSSLAVGKWLQAGEHIGYLYDAFSGEITQELRAPVSGLLSGLRRRPLVQAEELLARIQVR